MPKKWFSLLLALLLCAALLPSGAHAATPTQEEAVNWAWSQDGKYLEYSNNSPGFQYQCVDLIGCYLYYLGHPEYYGGVNDVGDDGGDAQTYVRKQNRLPSGWTYHYNSPQPGDIVVWDAYSKTWDGDTATGAAGHIGIVLAADSNNGTMTTMEQNVPDGHACRVLSGRSRPIHYAACFIRPAWCSHDPSYNTRTNGVCQLCHAWNPTFVTTVRSCDLWLTLKGTEAKAIRPGPFNDCGELRKLASGQKVHATAVVRNGRSSGEWYLLNADDGGNSMSAYIYSDNVKTTTAPPFLANFSGMGQAHKYAAFTVGETNAVLTGLLSVSGSASNSSVTKTGVILADASFQPLADKSENISTSADPIYLWYDVNSELGVTLNPGTTYYYQCYAVINGQTRYSEAYPFVTKGSSSVVQVAFSGFGQSHKHAEYAVGETNATLTGLLSVSGGASSADVSETGLILSDESGQQLAVKSEAISTSADPIYLWYDVNSELGYTLSPGTNYTYRFYAVVKGTAYYSDSKLFTTAGNSGPQDAAQVSFYDFGRSDANHGIYQVGNTDATLTGLLSVSGAASNADVTTTGMVLYDAAGQQELASASESISTAYDPIYMWYNVNSELHYTLSPATTYSYKFFAVVNGTRYYSEAQSFTTDGAPTVQANFHDFGFSDDRHATYSVGETDATLTVQLTVTGAEAGTNVGDRGLELFDAYGVPLASATDSDPISAAYDPIYMWYFVQNELHYTLTPGTTYRYRFFADVSGVRYYSETQTFMTEGMPPAPENCSLTADKGQDALYTASETVTLSFSADSATYYMLELYKDGVLLETVNTDTGEYGRIFDAPGTYGAVAVAINSYGRTYSERVNWTVAATLAIVTQPEDFEGSVGETATFTVEATGSNLTYQWQYWNGKKWANTTVSGAKTATITMPITEGRYTYQYRCVVTDASGETATSDAVRLVRPAVFEIVTQPVDYEGALGDTATFTVEAAGTDLSYQWQWTSGSKWYSTTATGNKTPTLTVEITQARLAYRYRCKITQGSETLTSAEVRLVEAAPVFEIVTQPEDFEGVIGETATFTVEATGSNLTYQWQYWNGKKWANTTVSGAKTATITMPITEGRYAYQYRCVVTDASGETATSDAVRLVRPAVFEIVTQPVDFEGALGDTATFTVEAAGTDLSYQWQWTSGSKWYSTTASGNKTPTLTVEITQARLAYRYRCKITQGSETLTSAEVRLVEAAPVFEIVTQPVDFEGAVGETATFTVEATGAGLSYQWQYWNGTKWANTTVTGNKTAAIEMKITESRLSYRYHCVITDAEGNQLISAAVRIVKL